MSKKFHLAITNNETGEVLIDADTSVIIGAYQGEANCAKGISAASCNAIELAQTVRSAQYTVTQTLADNPDVMILASMLKTETDEETNNEEENKED